LNTLAAITYHQQSGAIERHNVGKETLAEIGRSYGWTITRLTAWLESRDHRTDSGETRLLRIVDGHAAA
jgi:hypothetical protein